MCLVSIDPVVSRGLILKPVAELKIAVKDIFLEFPDRTLLSICICTPIVTVEGLVNKLYLSSVQYCVCVFYIMTVVHDVIAEYVL